MEVENPAFILLFHSTLHHVMFEWDTLKQEYFGNILVYFQSVSKKYLADSKPIEETFPVAIGITEPEFYL